MILDDVYCLPERVAIYIPTEFQNEIKEVQKAFNSNFGGSTLLNGIGSWNGVDGIEIENISVIYSNIETISNDVIELILEYARHIKITCKQEAVSVEFNGKLYLV